MQIERLFVFISHRLMMQGTDYTNLLLGNVIKWLCSIYFFTVMWFYAAHCGACQLILALTSGEWSIIILLLIIILVPSRSAPAEVRTPLAQPGHCREGYRSTAASARYRHRVPLRTPWTPWRRRKRDSPRSMAESNPLRGFPRLRRAAVISAGRLGGGRLQTGRWYCSRERKRGERFLR